jgi:hypothetical protein
VYVLTQRDCLPEGVVVVVVDDVVDDVDVDVVLAGWKRLRN